MPTDELHTLPRVEEPNTVLRGGPGRAGEVAEQYCHTEEAASTLKVRNGNCYDHFHEEPGQVAHQEGRALRVFRWSHRTYVAE